MVVAPLLWSMAGVITRHLDVARGFEITFWRSVFAAIFVAGALAWQTRGRPLAPLVAAGASGMLSGAMWAIMFCCFMIALTMTTVANTLIMMSVSPLLTALLTWLVLRQHIAPRTWIAIGVACIGIVWMFASGMARIDATQLTGMTIALGVPIAAAVNVIVIKKAGQQLDLAPAVFLGGCFSALLMLPFSWPFQASLHDIALLAVLGVFQLGLPCLLMVRAAKALSAPELSLLALLEVLLGPLWVWLGADEVPTRETLIGGGVVLAALVFNEMAAMRQSRLVA